jgi:hypothetical protein
MHWSIPAILAALWVLGILNSYTVSGHIHILLLIAFILVLGKVLQDRIQVRR